jgi:hypothetical protein
VNGTLVMPFVGGELRLLPVRVLHSGTAFQLQLYAPAPVGDVHGWLVVLHILLAIAWLGVDAGVFLGSHLIRNRVYAPEARFLVSRLMGYLDLSPRLAVQLTFAVGLHLAYVGGTIRLAQAEMLVWLTWALALVWCGCMIYAFVLQHRRETGHELTRFAATWLAQYRRVDLWARWLWIGGIVALLSSGAIVGTWLSLKFGLFLVVVLVGNALRMLPGTSSMAVMAEIRRAGSTPEREDALYRRLSLTHPLILTVYACVVVSIVLGVLKPG